MARQLDILALEPFYGGVRKQTLELLSRHSRHKWSIFKLPPRRIERRLTTAAQWFSQQISRTPALNCDVLFTSDALNLADFLRLKPDLGAKPSIAYFHCNQLSGEAACDQQARLALLATASASTEIWFSTLFHMRDFLCNVGAVFDAHRELGGRQQLRDLVAKGQLIHPPVEIVPPGKDSVAVDAQRKSRTLCLDNRPGGRMELFQAILREIASRQEQVSIHVLGEPLPGVAEGISTVQVDIKSDADVIQAMRRCEIYVSSQPCDEFDPLAMRAMAMGCIPILPRYGFYAEFLPTELHSWCLYDGTAEELLSRVLDLWYLRRPAVARAELDRIFSRYSPLEATALVDERLEHLAELHAAA